MNHKESPQDQIKPIIELFFSGQVQDALDDVETLINDFPNEPIAVLSADIITILLLFICIIYILKNFHSI